MPSQSPWQIRTRGSFGRFFHAIRKTTGNTQSKPFNIRQATAGKKGILQHLTEDRDRVRPVAFELGVWIGKVSTDALGAMREKQAEIHRGSQRQNIEPP